MKRPQGEKGTGGSKRGEGKSRDKALTPGRASQRPSEGEKKTRGPPGRDKGKGDIPARAAELPSNSTAGRRKGGEENKEGRSKNPLSRTFELSKDSKKKTDDEEDITRKSLGKSGGCNLSERGPAVEECRAVKLMGTEQERE